MAFNELAHRIIVKYIRPWYAADECIQSCKHCYFCGVLERIRDFSTLFERNFLAFACEVHGTD
jgi:hypothetical protein